VIYAKSNTPEFGAGANTFNEVFGFARNPRDLSRSAADSSGRRRRAGQRHRVACPWHRPRRLTKAVLLRGGKRDLLKPEVIWNIEQGLKLTMEDLQRAQAQRVAMTARALKYWHSVHSPL
jgi:Amidase